MKLRHASAVFVLVASAAAGWNAARAGDTRVDVDVHVEVLTRGPVHEAFAEAVTFDPEPSVVVVKAPPEPIDELPPDQQPEGDSVVWIPGYSAWDDDTQDFIWVTGVWREVPPNRQWVPGYWARTEIGFQWTNGYWADVDVEEVEYLPAPPEVIVEEPFGHSPSDDHIWVSGSWLWHHDHYVWRPGQWVVVQSDWDWVPAHYVWTPRGYVFVEGYWDYTVNRRGVLFAPVHFDAVVYRQPEYRYSPVTVIDVDVVTEHLFMRPQYCHYYFGDYYAVSYHDAGYLPAFSIHASKRGYDPIYARARWVHRHDHDWERDVQTSFVYRRENVEARPPRTLSAQIQLTGNKDASPRRGLVLAKSLEQVSESQAGAVRFRRVDLEKRKSIAARSKDVVRFSAERQKMEAPPAAVAGDAPAARADRGKVRLSPSPVSAKSAASSRSRVPPSRPKAPDPDPTVEAKPRKMTAKPASMKEPPAAEPKEMSDKPGPANTNAPAVKKTGSKVDPADQVAPKKPRTGPRPLPREEAKPQVEPKPESADPETANSKGPSGIKARGGAKAKGEPKSKAKEDSDEKQKDPSKDKDDQD